MNKIPSPKSKPRNALKALWVTICIMMAYGIFVFIVPKSGLDSLGYLIFTPVMLIAGYALSYLFFYCRSIGRLKWYFTGIAILVFLLLYSAFEAEINIWYKNKMNSQKLPAGYETYQDLNQPIIHFANKEMKLLFKSDENIQEALLPTNNLIIEVTHSNSDSTSLICFYKIDTTGKVIDSLLFNKTYKSGIEKIARGYIINDKHKYFKTWPLDGDTASKSMTLQNQYLNLDTSAEKHLIDKIFNSSDFILVDYDYDYHYLPKAKEKNIAEEKNDSVMATEPLLKTVDVVTYLLDGKWYQFYTLQNVTYKLPLEYLLTESHNTLFKKLDKDLDWQVIPQSNIIYKYFQKIKLENYAWSIGGGSSGSNENRWRGKLYSNLIVDKDTLKISDNLYLNEEWFQTRVQINGKKIGTLYNMQQQPADPLMFYSNKNLAYSLFTNDEKKLYIIKTMPKP